VTFSTLLKSGLPALKALDIVRDVVNNEVLRETIDIVRETVLEGGDISAPMKKSTVFPPVVGYMVAVGEESGELENILTQIAESYDEEIEIATAKLTSVIEPIMILAMAGIVGFIVASILLPMLEMSTM
jgi:type II secretory pathway component PulF